MAWGEGRPMLQAKAGVSRRRFVGGAIGLAGAAGALPCLAGLGGMRPAVVAFHADRLYLDRRAGAEPYIPPPGLRSLEGMDETTLRGLVYAL